MVGALRPSGWSIATRQWMCIQAEEHSDHIPPSTRGLTHPNDNDILKVNIVILIKHGHLCHILNICCLIKHQKSLIDIWQIIWKNWSILYLNSVSAMVLVNVSACHYIQKLIFQAPTDNCEDETCKTFVLHNEDHTLGNALRYMIMKK